MLYVRQIFSSVLNFFRHFLICEDTCDICSINAKYVVGILSTVYEFRYELLFDAVCKWLFLWMILSFIRVQHLSTMFHTSDNIIFTNKWKSLLVVLYSSLEDTKRFHQCFSRGKNMITFSLSLFKGWFPRKITTLLDWLHLQRIKKISFLLSIVDTVHITS